MPASRSARAVARRHAVLDQVVTTTRSRDEHTQGMPAHFLNTPSAAVARIWVGPDLVEVVRWKRGNKYPTYQGCMVHDAHTGRWMAKTNDGVILGVDFQDYRDGEVQLLEHQTRYRSQATLHWPLEIHAHRRDDQLPLCRTCQHPVRGLACNRYGLHSEIRRGLAKPALVG